MKNFVINAQKITLLLLGVLTLCILGAEPGTTESSMYQYEHAFEYGNVGWFLGWFWGIALTLFLILTFIRYRISINE